LTVATEVFHDMGTHSLLPCTINKKIGWEE
jgi:hypothetical protein